MLALLYFFIFALCQKNVSYTGQCAFKYSAL